MKRSNSKNKTNDLSTNIKTSLRYNEYYNLQSTFDTLYQKAKEGKTFHHLYDIIRSRENILLAYRSIKRNTGSKTAGVNKRTIKDWEKVDIENFVRYFQTRFDDYTPLPIRRKWIPKADGKQRPLGIPTIEDRLIQQCIKQVLEPVCEAHFHSNSYGFRPNRSTEHAIVALNQRINLGKHKYVIDVDIKGFFDNVNHCKLIKQLWTLGIQEKKVLSIIKKIMKAPVKNENEESTKGVPQGGILSPLLANVVLNELDWWVSSQWESYQPYKKKYAVIMKGKGEEYRGSIYRALRGSKLKEVYIIRYADDFKIVCKKKNHAKKMYHAVRLWLRDRLDLEVNDDKSGIVNVRKKSTDFLGFQVKAVKKGKEKSKAKWVAHSRMKKKARKNVKMSIKDQIKKVQKNLTEKNIRQLNSMIVGVQNYYRIATHVSIDFREINYNLLKTMRNRLGKSSRIRDSDIVTNEFKDRYKKKGKFYHAGNWVIYPIESIKHKNPMMFTQEICDYTERGRKLIHDKIGHINIDILHYLSTHPVKQQSVEFNDNRISLYSAQKGKCAICKRELDVDMETHHKEGRMGSNPDRYNNLVIVMPEMHKLIHAIHQDVIEKYLNVVKLDQDGLKKLNLFRNKIGNPKIKLS